MSLSRTPVLTARNLNYDDMARRSGVDKVLFGLGSFFFVEVDHFDRVCWPRDAYTVAWRVLANIRNKAPVLHAEAD